jgi:hypothetical protein
MTAPLNLPVLCGVDGCRRLHGHRGEHDMFPTEAWGFLADKDRDKLTKAGFATPRGGAKGAYQNHVARNNKVIIPFEWLNRVKLADYPDGFVVRLLPDQFFADAKKPRPEFLKKNPPVTVGKDAFVLYRTHDDLKNFPPMPEWEVRYLVREGQKVEDRGDGAEDRGHYVLRVAAITKARTKRHDGPPQGIFAPEYADRETNYFCKCVLAWLIIQTRHSPYTTLQAGHLRAILNEAKLLDAAGFERRNSLRHGITCCPLCLRTLEYEQLHSTIVFEDEAGTGNAAFQIEGATRSTHVNLFHLIPLVYTSLEHRPEQIAWGHGICNTRLGQRRCYSLQELKERDLKVGVIREEGIETFGWISEDFQMIRSPHGAVWIQLNGDTVTEDDLTAPPATAKG